MNSQRSTIQSYRKILEEKKIRLEILNGAKKRFIKESSELKKEAKTLQETRDIFQRAAVLTQNHLAEHLSSIVTKSLRMIWEESNISFHAKFVERRNSTECDMWVEEDDHKYSLLDGKGYGVVDVISFSLKVAYILLHTVDNVCIIDEPFRNTDKTKHESLSMLITNLSEELNMQFIVCTHMEKLKEYSHKSFYIKNGQIVA